jgi:hypothetical protein
MRLKKVEKQHWLSLSRADSLESLIAPKPTAFGRVVGHL